MAPRDIAGFRRPACAHRHVRWSQAGKVLQCHEKPQHCPEWWHASNSTDLSKTNSKLGSAQHPLLRPAPNTEVCKGGPQWAVLFKPTPAAAVSARLFREIAHRDALENVGLARRQVGHVGALRQRGRLALLEHVAERCATRWTVRSVWPAKRRATRRTAGSVWPAERCAAHAWAAGTSRTRQQLCAHAGATDRRRAYARSTRSATRPTGSAPGRTACCQTGQSAEAATSQA